MNKADQMVKDLFNRILREGCKDHNPRPKYKDGTPAHTLSINHVLQTYDLSKYELPLITLRPNTLTSLPSYFTLLPILGKRCFSIV